MKPEDEVRLSPEDKALMDSEMQLSPQARALLDDPKAMAQLDPRHALSLEVMRRIGGTCTGWELEEHCDQLVALCGGSDAEALEALRSGKVEMRTH
jgi:hypothetical protein